MTDVVVEYHGSVALLRPMTAEAGDWITEHCAPEPWQYLGEALACEPRYVAPIIDGLREDGFTVSGGSLCL
jgi:hypothetical protein